MNYLAGSMISAKRNSVPGPCCFVTKYVSESLVLYKPWFTSASADISALPWFMYSVTLLFLCSASYKAAVTVWFCNISHSCVFFDDQCGREYHVGCLKEHNMADLTVIFLTLDIWQSLYPKTSTILMINLCRHCLREHGIVLRIV